MAEKEQEFSHRQARYGGRLKFASLAISSLLTSGVISLAFYMEYRSSPYTDEVVYAMATLIGVAIGGRLIVQHLSRGG